MSAMFFFSILLIWTALKFIFFFFNDTATTEIYTLSLHDALPICFWCGADWSGTRTIRRTYGQYTKTHEEVTREDRKSTRLNSSHLVISYAVFCLKKKNACTTSGCHRTEKKRHHGPSNAAIAKLQL